MPPKIVKWRDPNRADSYYRRLEIGGGVYAEEVIALPPTVSRVAGGRFYLASSGRLTLAVAGNVRATVGNPAGSGRNLSVVRIASFGTATGYSTLFMNPTAGLPAGVRTPRNALIGGGDAAVGLVRVDTDATTPLSGGVDMGLVFGLPANSRTTIDLPPIVLAPGVTLGINVPFAGAADATMSVYWYEDDAV